jgi:lysophospholipase L1-like esterase
MIHYKNILLEQDDKKKLRVLFLGDSQTAMSSISYAYKLLRNGVVDGNVVAKGGANTKQILEMMRNAINDSYDVVCILAGSNDAWRTTAEVSAKNLTAMYNLAHQNGALVIAITNPTKKHTKDPSKFPGADPIAEWIRSQNISDFVVDAHSLTQDRSNFLGDRIHFNQNGQNIIYDAVKQVLDRIQGRTPAKTAEIRDTQAKLQRLGFDLGNEAEQGIEGPKTKAALTKLNSKYQEANAQGSWSDKALKFVNGILSSDFVQSLFGNKPEKAAAPAKKATNAEQVVTFFKNKGLTTSQSAGIAGNIQVESGFKTTALGDSGTSFGLAQWHKERRTKLTNWCNKNGLDPNSMQGQLEFLWHELNTTEKTALNALKKQTDPKQAAYVFAKLFERPSTISSSRLKYAEDIYNNITQEILNKLT